MDPAGDAHAPAVSRGRPAGPPRLADAVREPPRGDAAARRRRRERDPVRRRRSGDRRGHRRKRALPRQGPVFLRRRPLHPSGPHRDRRAHRCGGRAARLAPVRRRRHRDGAVLPAVRPVRQPLRPGDSRVVRGTQRLEPPPGRLRPGGHRPGRVVHHGDGRRDPDRGAVGRRAGRSPAAAHRAGIPGRDRHGQDGAKSPRRAHHRARTDPPPHRRRLGPHVSIPRPEVSEGITARRYPKESRGLPWSG